MWYNRSMKTVVKIKLLPDPDVSEALRETLTLANQAANFAAHVASDRGISKFYDLRKVTYGDIKEMGLGSQIAQHAVKKAVDAAKTRKGNAKSGRYGKKDSPRYQKIMGKPVTFRDDAAHPFDDRNLSWNHEKKTISIWTTRGRLVIPFTGEAGQLRALAGHRQGESDLMVDRQGRWFLIATLDYSDPDLIEPDGFIGVDMGIAVIAATATDSRQHGKSYSGKTLKNNRAKNRRLRTRLQKKGTKSAKRLLKKRTLKESRYAKDVNHQISKKIVSEAKRTGRGVAVEKLTGIRDRVRHRKPQRDTFYGWSYGQLGEFLSYKARREGIPFIEVDPHYTSQECSRCGHTTKENRATQESFRCVECGLSLNADTNAAINIARRGTVEWQVAVNQPNVA